MVTEPNSFEDPEFLKDSESINDRLPKTDAGQPRSESPAIADVTELRGALAAPNAGRETRLNEELEQACLATGATGAAIALVRGQEMVCHAAAGPHAPSVGVSLDPRTGLSGSCIQTRRLQQCVDTQTDPRVNAEACRRLGVRSIVALPLMEGDELFGIVEILSSRPNAFSAQDLDSLKALTHRIVETRRQDRKTTATVAREGSASFQPKLDELVLQYKSQSAEPKSESPGSERVSRRNDMWTPVLGTLVIGAAILLGILMGWRHGWEKATLGFRASSPLHRVDAPPRNVRADQTVSPEQELRPSSVGTEDCGQSAAAGSPVESLSGGLTICQQGKIIFRLPPSAPRTQRNLQTPQRSTGLGGDTATR
jgi:GAF domain